MHDLASKLNRANAVLAKVRHFLNIEILRSTNLAMFYSQLNYVCIAWRLARFPPQKVSILKKKKKKKILRTMNFTPFNAHTTPLFKNCNILNFVDIINI